MTRGKYLAHYATGQQVSGAKYTRRYKGADGKWKYEYDGDGSDPDPRTPNTPPSQSRQQPSYTGNGKRAKRVITSMAEVVKRNASKEKENPLHNYAVNVANDIYAAKARHKIASIAGNVQSAATNAKLNNVANSFKNNTQAKRDARKAKREESAQRINTIANNTANKVKAEREEGTQRVHKIINDMADKTKANVKYNEGISGFDTAINEQQKAKNKNRRKNADNLNKPNKYENAGTGGAAIAAHEQQKAKAKALHNPKPDINRTPKTTDENRYPNAGTGGAAIAAENKKKVEAKQLAEKSAAYQPVRDFAKNKAEAQRKNSTNKAIYKNAAKMMVDDLNPFKKKKR